MYDIRTVIKLDGAPLRCVGIDRVAGGLTQQHTVRCKQSPSYSSLELLMDQLNCIHDGLRCNWARAKHSCRSVAKTSSDTEVVGNLLVLMLGLRQRDSDGIAAATINETDNQNDDNSAMRSSIVASPQHHRRASNHTDMMVFVPVQTSSDTEVAGDLL